jgi:hypothetical protein
MTTGLLSTIEFVSKPERKLLLAGLVIAFGSALACNKTEPPPVLIAAADLCNSDNIGKRAMVDGYFLHTRDFKCVSKNQGPMKCMLDFDSADEKSFQVHMTSGDAGANIVNQGGSKDDPAVFDFERKKLEREQKTRLTGTVVKAEADIKASYIVFKGCFLDAARVEKAPLSDAEASALEARKGKQKLQAPVIEKFVADHPDFEIKKYEISNRLDGFVSVYSTYDKTPDLIGSLKREAKSFKDVGFVRVMIYDEDNKYVPFAFP